MVKERLLEILGLAMLGEGVIGMFFPRRYSLFWEIGPAPLRNLMAKAADNPEIMRLICTAEAGLGFWLAMSQLRRLPEKNEMKNA